MISAHVERARVADTRLPWSGTARRARVCSLVRLGMMRRVLAIVAVLLVLGMAAGAFAWHWLDTPMTQRASPVVIEIVSGTTPRQVADTAVRAGLDVPAWGLYAWFRSSGQARRIRAGNYEFGAGTTPREMLARIVEGDETLAQVRLIEGWTLAQWRRELGRAPGLRADTAPLDERQLMEALGVSGQAGEGRFYPDTYRYARGSSDLQVLRRAHQAMQRHLEEAWMARDAASPLRTPDELLTLASIVEKETGHPEDRGLVAGVFANRLKLGMPLQTDPTVIYGLGAAFDGNLRKRDLLTDGPFNTYTRRGLPPTPIASPGRASLFAAARPAPTRALYFVARGDGRSEFNEQLADHNRAVQRYQRQSQGRLDAADTAPTAPRRLP